jgi:hypothetical protein
MMRCSQKYLAIAMAWAWFLTTSAANAVVLDFAGLDAINLEHPVDYYAGGFGSLGSGPGPDYGVTFSPGLYICAAAPASGCSTALVPSGNPLIPGGGSSIMNVANGFTTGLSFYYSSEHGAGAIIYTGLMRRERFSLRWTFLGTTRAVVVSAARTVSLLPTVPIRRLG